MPKDIECCLVNRASPRRYNGAPSKRHDSPSTLSAFDHSFASRMSSRRSDDAFTLSTFDHSFASFDRVIYRLNEGTGTHAHAQSLMLLAILKGDLASLKQIVSRHPNPPDLMNHVNGAGWNSVFLATHAGHADVMTYLLDNGADLESPTGAFYGLLAVACRLRRLEVIPVLLHYGVDPCARNYFGVTCLHAIAQFGTMEIAEAIFGDKPHKLRKIIDRQDDFGMTSLLYAIKKGHLEFCQWLIDRGADTRARGRRHETPFIAACHHGNPAIMNLFISLDKSKSHVMLHESDEDGMNGLHHAVAENNMEATLTLISLGADVNGTTHDGSTPLHLCAKSGFSSLVTVLMRSGARPDVGDDKSCTPLHRAAEFHHTETLVTLIRQGGGMNQENCMGCTPLFTACCHGYADMVQRLLALHADYRVKDYMGVSCLQAAVEHRHWTVFNILLKACDREFVLSKDITERTALHRAASLKDTRFAKALLGHEELVTSQDMSGQIPLHHAARSGNSAMVTLLAEVTSNINAETHETRTPLIFACEAGDTKSALTLIQMGANVNHRILNSFNTLMIATSSGSTSLVEELIRSGVNVNTLDHIKNTALHLACHQGHLSIVRTLLQHGASVTATNARGDTPLLVAVTQAHEDVASFLVRHHSWKESLSVEDADGDNSLVAMTTHTPKAAKIVLDQCVTRSHHPKNDHDLKVEFCFKYLEVNPRGKNFKEKAYKVLLSMILNDREDLLAHPVCQAFLVYKWNKFGRAYLSFNIIVQFAFFVFALIYIKYVPPMELLSGWNPCNPPPPSASNASANTTHSDSPSSDQYYDDDLVVVSSLGMIISLVLVVLKELRFLCASGWRYLSSGQFLSTMLAGSLITGSFYPFGQYPCAVQWRLLAAGMAVYSYSSSLVFTRIDYVGLYFSMFYEVLRTILKMGVVLVFFVATMAIPLKIYLRLQRGFRDGDPFPLTALSMMIGELNYRDIFIKGDNRPFTFETYVFFVVFVLGLNITFMNMMIGAAVGDIENVEKRAYLTRLKSQVTFLEEVESTFVPAFRDKFCLERYVVYPNQKKSKWLKWLRRFTSQNAMTFIEREEDRDDFDNLHDVISQQNKQIKELKELTHSIRHEMRRLTLRSHPDLSSSRQNSDDDVLEGEEAEITSPHVTHLHSNKSSKL